MKNSPRASGSRRSPRAARSASGTCGASLTSRGWTGRGWGWENFLDEANAGQSPQASEGFARLCDVRPPRLLRLDKPFSPRYNMKSAFPPIAQLDRVSDSDSEGRGFESLWAGHQAEPGRNSRPRPSLFFFPRRSRLGRYLFCRRRSLKGRQNRCRPDFLGFMRVCGLFESEFSSTLHRRCPNPELDIFPFAGPFIRFFGKGSPFRLV